MKILKKVVPVIIITTLPLLIIISSIRLVLTPLFLEVEYRLPGFPNDPFGFNLEQRLQWSKISMQYLVNANGIDFLSSRQLANGQPLYEERELGHMQDVKELTRTTLSIWYVMLGLYLTVIFWSWKNGLNNEFGNALSTGSWVTLGLVGMIIVGVVINFDTLFTSFHRIFFEGDTWLFSYSNSLIRLFPLRFWQDVFITIGGLSIFFSLLAAFIGQKTSISST